MWQTGFIVVAACVMTFEARDSAAKVVPARLKMNSASVSCGHVSHGGSGHGSLRTSGSQTATLQHQHPQPDRRAITQSFMQFSKGLALETQQSKISNSLKVPQVKNLLDWIKMLYWAKRNARKIFLTVIIFKHYALKLHN